MRAEEARQITCNTKDDDLKPIFEAIQKQAKLGHYCMFYWNLNGSQRMRLTDLGYSVAYSGNDFSECAGSQERFLVSW